MTYRLLQRMAKGPLPMTFSGGEEIAGLRILKDAGWIKATFSAPPEHGGTATVTELTALGRFAMQFVPSEDDNS